VPGTGKRVYRARPESEWVRTDTPHLRIVTDEMFAAVQRRFVTVKKLFGRDGGGLATGPKRYLFSGLLKCAECGGSIALVCGRGRHGADRYGCAIHHQRGDSVCKNTILVRRDVLEESLLRGLTEKVLRTQVVEYIILRLEESLRERYAKLDKELESMRQRRQKIETELANLVQVIASGQVSKAVTAAIADREEELRSITDRLLEPKRGSIRAKMDELRDFAMSRLANLRRLIDHPESVDEARAALAEHFGSFVISQVEQDGKIRCEARGSVDFIGDSAMARTGGAGGQNRTGYARLFRAALYH
jgi:site-specific DNA recombinase